MKVPQSTMEVVLSAHASTGGVGEAPNGGSQRSDSLASDQSATSSKRRGSRTGSLSFQKKQLAIQIPKDDANNDKNPDFKTPIYVAEEPLYHPSEQSSVMERHQVAPSGQTEFVAISDSDSNLTYMHRSEASSQHLEAPTFGVYNSSDY